MCTAILGATPVNRWTCAASSAFSHGVRGTPGWPKTLNRVPVFPNAHEGSSICCARSASLTTARSAIAEPDFWLGPVRIRYASVTGRPRSRGDLRQVGAEQVGGGTELGQQVAGAERPVVGDAGRAPVIGPLAGIAAEVDPGRRVADLQQRAGHDPAGRGHEPERAVALLADAERGDRPVLDVELDRDSPAALAVVHAKAAQQRLALADGQVRRAVVAHLDHAVAEVE